MPIPSPPGAPQPNFLVKGIVINKGNKSVGALVQLTNVNKQDTLVLNTSSGGEFIFDIANLSANWSNGDKIQITAISNDRKSSTYFNISGYYNDVGYLITSRIGHE